MSDVKSKVSAFCGFPSFGYFERTDEFTIERICTSSSVSQCVCDFQLVMHTDLGRQRP